MSEQMNTDMEKKYFSYILDNPDQFSKIDPSYFKNDEISFVYKIVHDEYLVSTHKIVPSRKQIVSMTRLHDPDQKIVNNNSLKLILDPNVLNNIEIDNWLVPRFKGWKLSSSARDKVSESIEIIRNIKDIGDYDNVKKVTSQLKSLFDNLTLVDDDDKDIGDDFDDPDSHKPDVNKNKIPSGWLSVDQLLGGGWDHASLSVILGETSIGKCSHYDSKIKIRNKITGEDLYISIGDFFNKIKK